MTNILIEVSKTKAVLKDDCKTRAVALDNESILTAPDWNECYDVAYEKLGNAAPLAREASVEH